MWRLNDICRKYLCIFFLGCALFHSFWQEAWGKMGPDRLQGYIVLKPLPIVGRKVMEVMQESNMPKEQLAFLYLFLGFLGYPDFQYFSKEDGVYVFMYDDENVADFKWVVAAKLKENSGKLERIKGLNWLTSNYKGWTLISDRREGLKLMESNKVVDEILGQRREDDVWMKVFLEDTLKYVNKLKGESSEWLMYGMALEKAQVLIGNCETLDIGCNINEEMVAIDLLIKPREKDLKKGIVSQTESIEAYKLGQCLEKYLEKILKEGAIEEDGEREEYYETIVHELEKDVWRKAIVEVKTSEKAIEMKIKIPIEAIGGAIQIMRNEIASEI